VPRKTKIRLTSLGFKTGLYPGSLSLGLMRHVPAGAFPQQVSRQTTRLLAMPGRERGTPPEPTGASLARTSGRGAPPHSKTMFGAVDPATSSPTQHTSRRRLARDWVENPRPLRRWFAGVRATGPSAISHFCARFSLGRNAKGDRALRRDYSAGGRSGRKSAVVSGRQRSNKTADADSPRSSCGLLLGPGRVLRDQPRAPSARNALPKQAATPGARCAPREVAPCRTGRRPDRTFPQPPPKTAQAPIAPDPHATTSPPQPPKRRGD